MNLETEPEVSVTYNQLKIRGNKYRVKETVNNVELSRVVEVDGMGEIRIDHAWPHGPSAEYIDEYDYYFNSRCDYRSTKDLTYQQLAGLIVANHQDRRANADGHWRQS